MKKTLMASVVLLATLSNSSVSYAMKPTPSYTGIQPAPAKPNMPQFRQCSQCGSTINGQAIACAFCGKRK